MPPFVVRHAPGLLGAFVFLVAATSAAQSTATGAVRAPKPPVIDGRETDAAWQLIAPTRGFRQYEPTEDGPPTFETEFRVAYDDDNLYVLVRAFDPHPDSIARLLSRRDVKTTSDQLTIFIDAHFDRRNAIQLAVNPAGVKRDGVWYGDATQDNSWDGVWDVATSIDEKGWVAEFSVPLSQLRYSARDVNTFGLAVAREIPRLNQKDGWPLYRPSIKRVVSQFGTIEGIRGLPSPRRLEVLPYTVLRSVPDLAHPGASNRSEITGGVDAKIGLGPSLTVDATVNPDFGQVESDPSILNLSAFEIRFDEKRPFFQEGIGLFRCGGPCDGPFYTRRIGRTPQLRTSPDDPAFTTILGAAKLTGRLSNGVTVALLDAVTSREVGAGGKTVEPASNYFVTRIARESQDGSRSMGVLITDVRRNLDDATEPFLRRTATTGIAQYVQRFADNTYEVMGYTGRSWVTGSAAAIAATQRSSVHYYQRPDHEEHYDPTRTALYGGASGGSFTRIRGAFKWSTFVRHSSPGQEMNDIGLVPIVGDQHIRQTADFTQLSPNRWFRSSFSQISAESHWTTGGMPATRFGTLHTSATLHNNIGGALTFNFSDLGGVNCVSCARGGPSVRQSSKWSARGDLSGDARRSVVPSATLITGGGDEGRSFFTEVNAGATLRVGARFSTSVVAAYNLGVNDQQWVGNFGALLSDTTHYTFARLDQRTLAFVTRLNWTATPTVSFQFYGQPFISTGAYSNWRELASPRAESYSTRFRTYGGGASPEGFNVKQFNSNAVVRWEFRPASVLFLVWQQGRAQSNVNAGTFEASRDVNDLFAAPPQNTLLLKLSYWFNP